MPKWDGKKTLRYLKNHPVWSAIPVLILSTSENKVEKEVCAGLGAHSFLKKPFHYEGYKDIVQNLLPFLHQPSCS
jgi:CheY-like chemotaxis protein